MIHLSILIILSADILSGAQNFEPFLKEIGGTFCKYLAMKSQVSLIHIFSNLCGDIKRFHSTCHRYPGNIFTKLVVNPLVHGILGMMHQSMQSSILRTYRQALKVSCV